MKKFTGILLALVFILSTITVFAEGLLPTLGDIYGVDMPSMGAVVLRDPKKVENEKDGTKKVTYADISEEDFNEWSNYIEQFGCSLVDYNTEGSLFTATIEKDGAQMVFSYDNAKEIAVLSYPSGTNVEEINYIERMFVAGNVVRFGTFEQDNNTKNGAEPIEWLVLAVENGKSLLLSKKVLIALEFHNTDKDKKISWDNCDLKAWMNKDFMKSFSNIEQNVIVKGAIGTVFLLNDSEVEKYLPLERDRICEATEYSVQKYGSRTSWWLRNTYYDNHYVNYTNNGMKAYLVYAGKIDDGSFNYTYGVRPAIWVDISGKGIQEWLNNR